MLHRLARIGLETTGAQRSIVFLLEGRELVPEVAAAGRGDEMVLAELRAMGPTVLDGERWTRLCTGRALMIEDADLDDVVPRTWHRQFRPGAVALVPLMAGRYPSGLLVVDWPEPKSFEPDEITLLEALGACAGLAVRNARDYEAARRRARLQQALTRGAASLATALDSASVTDVLAGAYTELIGARLCAIALLDRDRRAVTAVASRGTRDLPVPIPLVDLPRHVVDRVSKEWEHAKVPVELSGEPTLDDLVGADEAGADWYLVVPFVVGGRTRGFVLLGFEHGRRLDSDERQGISALADLAGTALDRCRLVDDERRSARRLDALYRAAAALVEGGDAETLAAAVNGIVADQGVRVTGLTFGDPDLARQLGTGTPTDEELAAWRGGEPSTVLGDGSTSVPMRLGDRLVGTMRVQVAEVDGDARTFLEALAHGLAEVAERERLRSEVAQAGLERMVFWERERLASDLHDTAGQVFVAIQLMTRDAASRRQPGSDDARFLLRLAELAHEGKWEIDQAARALAFMPSLRRGLEESLRELARELTSDSGIQVDVDLDPEAVSQRLAPETERALYRVAHEGLANAWRHAGCGRAWVELRRASQDALALTLRDDGRGMERPDLEEGVGIAGMRRAVGEVGGSLKVGPGADGGFVVEATVPTKGRQA